jgi:hypothetical protein
MADQNIHQQVLARVIKDQAFRQALVNNPKAVLAKEYNVQFPDDVTIRIMEDTPTTHTFVLPVQETAVQELSDAELEAVAGGLPPRTNPSCDYCITDYPNKCSNVFSGCW